MARILQLTLLAPDIIEAVLAGTEPDGLSLEKLYQAGRLGGAEPAIGRQ